MATPAGQQAVELVEQHLAPGAALFARENIRIDAHNPATCVLFPEMDADKDVAEITTGCWDILGKSPADIMCASSRMVCS